MSKPWRVLAVDPGRQKCGLALVDADQGILARGIVASDVLALVVRRWISDHRPRMLVIGNGTAMGLVRASLGEIGLPLEICPEEHTTLRARRRYFEENPPRGWRRLLPRGLLVPPVPVDDYAAVLIAEDYLNWARAEG